MTQIFDDTGRVLPATVLEAGPCHITQELTEEKNGYRAVQIGFGEKKLNKPEIGHLKDFIKNKISSFSILREFPLAEDENLKKGDIITVDSFEKGDKVNVRGVSKGKGFQGVVKRWNFAGGPASHGQKHSLRKPGSIGSAYPQRVMKGKKMAGRMGGKNHTVRNLKIVDILPEKNAIIVKGSVPGNNGSVVQITKI